MSFVIYSRKTGTCWNQHFFYRKLDHYRKSELASCGSNKICQIFILTLCLVTPHFFLEKIAQILQKVIKFSPKGEWW